MNPYSIPPFLTSIIALAGGLFVYFKKRKSVLNRTFAFLCIATFWWQFSWFILFNTENYSTALVLSKIGYCGIIFIPISFVHFIYLYLKVESKKFIVLSYVIGVFFLISIWLGWFLDGVYTYTWGYYPKAGIAHPFHLLQLIILTFYILKSLWEKLKESKKLPIRRNQVKYLILAILFYLPAVSDYAVNYGFEMYPIGFIFVLLSLGFFGFTIFKHRLMDINLVVTRGALFGAVYVIVLIVPFGLALMGRDFLQVALGENWWVIPLLVAVLIASLGPAVYSKLKEKAEWTLFKKQKKYQQTLVDIGNQMVFTKDTDKLLSLITKTVSESVGVGFTSIFLWDKEKKSYILRKKYGRGSLRKDTEFGSRNAVVSYLHEMKEPVLKEEIVNYYKSSRPDSYEEIERRLEEMNVELFIPFFVKERMLGFMLLGEKKNNQIYTPEDIDMFKILARQAALVIKNKMMNSELVKREKLAAIGKVAGAVGHDLRSPLASIKNSSFYLEKYGSIKDEQSKRLLSVLNEEVSDAEEIVNSLFEFGSGRDIQKSEVLLAPLIESVIGRMEVREGVDVEVDIKDKKLTVMAESDKVKRLIKNLVKNGCQAIEGRGVVRVRAFREGDRVKIVVKDTGKGMDEETRRKIFEPLYTTKESGIGLGMSIIKEIVEAHGWEIEVESELGEGSKFIVIVSSA